MATISDIVEINISRETSAVSRAGFNIPMFLGTHSNFPERQRSYTNLAGVAEDFNSTDPAYIAATRLFGQDIEPPEIVIGKRYADSVDVSVLGTSGTITNTYNGTEVVTDVSGAADATAAVGLIESDFTAASITGITFTDNLDGTYTVAPTTSGDDYSFKVEPASAVSVTYNASETYVDALDEVSNINNDWYALVTETHADADILSIAAAIEARRKIYGTSTSNTDVLSAVSTTDIGQQLYDLGYTRTFIMYHADADTAYPEAAWIGGQLPEQPGSNTWKFKTLAGIPVSPLSTSQFNAAKDKNVNVYQRVGGVGITAEGVTGSGEYIDVTSFIDWLEARMQERIYFRLVNLKKVPLELQQAA